MRVLASGRRLATVLFAFGATLAIAPVQTRAQTTEYRAFWVDAWGAGFLNQSQVDALLGVPGTSTRGQIRDANCNMVIVQVRRRADVCYPSAMGEPYFSGLSPSNFNALQAMINAAHDTTGGKQRVEVHCWSVVFKTAKGLVYSQHSDPDDPENYWPTRLGSTTGAENSDGAFDPGHPRCLEYLVNVHMDLVNNFDIDGIHYDYIRFEGNTEGYNPTSVARYNARYGLSGEPSSSNEQFRQWRRDQVTAFVRQMYARIQAAKPWVAQSGSFVTWNPSPTSSTRSAFMATRPYYDVYSDWDSWVQEGIVDMAVPMTYYNWASLPNDYTRWMNFEKDRKFNRHMIVGPGIYLNSLDNAIYELQQTRWASPAGNYAHGFSGYSYRVPYSGGNWAAFAPRLVQDVTPAWVGIPPKPWKTNPTMGHIMGTVTYASNGAWADHAIVTVNGPANRSMYVDGTGFYAFIDLPPGSYTVTASRTGYPNASAAVNVAIGDVTGNMYVQDLVLGGNPPPQISNVQAINIGTGSATITWNTSTPADSQVRYGLTPSYGSQTPVDPAQVTAHSVTLTGLADGTTYHYQVVSTNAYGTAQSADATFATLQIGAEIVIDNTDPGWTDTSTTGSWNVGSSEVVPKIGTNYLYASSTGNASESSATTKCRWTPTITTPGYYDVYVYYQIGANRNNAAPYKVVYDGGEVTSIQNQYSSTPNQGGWFLVGQDLPFVAGTAGYVQCSNNSTHSGYISADAARFVLKGVLPPPTITQHPQPQAVCPSTGAAFTVAASGYGTLTYRWQRDGVDLSNGGHYSGVATPTLNVAGADAGDVGSYRCVVGNAGGSTTSNAASLSLLAGTAITQQPQSQVVDAGGTVQFAVVALGQGTLGYQWQKDGLPLSDGGHYSGTTTAVLTVFNATAADAGIYACTVTAGCGSATSTAATLTVNLPAFKAADFDRDGDVDLTDFGTFQACFNGPNRVSAAGCAADADLDRDSDVDLGDFSLLQLCFNGPNRPPTDNCP